MPRLTQSLMVPRQKKKKKNMRVNYEHLHRLAVALSISLAMELEMMSSGISTWSGRPLGQHKDELQNGEAEMGWSKG